MDLLAQLHLAVEQAVDCRNMSAVGNYAVGSCRNINDPVPQRTTASDREKGNKSATTGTVQPQMTYACFGKQQFESSCNVDQAEVDAAGFF